jgi:hypothetical protein
MRGPNCALGNGADGALSLLGGPRMTEIHPTEPFKCHCQMAGKGQNRKPASTELSFR